MAGNNADNQMDQQTLVLSRNFFYRDNHRRLMVFSFLLILMNFALFTFIWYQHNNRPSPVYFATHDDGKMIDIVPLNKPNIRTNALLNWSTEAATSVYNFDFVHYRSQLQKAKIYFTTTGFRNFLSALKDSNNLKAVQQKKLVVSAVARGAPVILDEGELQHGVYAWKIQVPMLITYQSVSEYFTQNVIIEMLVVRQSTLKKPKGIAIQYMLVKAQSGSKRG